MRPPASSCLPIAQWLGSAVASLLLFFAPACLAHAMPSKGKVAILSPYGSVVRILGKPLAEGATGLCPQSHVAFYRGPDAMLKLAFDQKGDVRAISLVLTRKPRPGAETVHWPGLDTSFAVLRPFASHPDLTSWSFNLGAKQLQYWEARSGSTTSPEIRYFFGTVVIDDQTELTAGGEFPSQDADWMGNLRNESNFNDERLVAMPGWRQKTVPNAFMVATSEPSNADNCSYQSLVGFDYSNPEKNLKPSPWFLGAVERPRK